MKSNNFIGLTKNQALLFFVFCGVIIGFSFYNMGLAIGEWHMFDQTCDALFGEDNWEYAGVCPCTDGGCPEIEACSMRVCQEINGTRALKVSYK